MNGKKETGKDGSLQSETALRRLGGNTNLYLLLLEKFLQSEAGIPDAMHEAWLNGDWQGLAHLGHRLKGAAASIGAERLAGFAEDLEAAACGNDHALACRTIEQISQELALVTAELTGYLDRGGR